MMHFNESQSLEQLDQIRILKNTDKSFRNKIKQIQRLRDMQHCTIQLSVGQTKPISNGVSIWKKKDVETSDAYESTSF